MFAGSAFVVEDEGMDLRADGTDISVAVIGLLCCSRLLHRRSPRAPRGIQRLTFDAPGSEAHDEISGHARRIPRTTA